MPRGIIPRGGEAASTGDGDGDVDGVAVIVGDAVGLGFVDSGVGVCPQPARTARLSVAESSRTTFSVRPSAFPMAGA